MRVSVAVAAVVMLAGCAFLGDEDTATKAARANFVSDLVRLGKEEPHGLVGLVPAAGKTRVLVEVFDPSSNRQQAGIRQGNCDVMHGGTVYRLEAVVDGYSETIVDVPLRELRRSGYLVFVGEPGPHLGGLCGDLYRSQPPDAAPTFD